MNIHIQQLHTIDALRFRLLILWSRVLLQNLADQASDAYDRELASSLSETERTRLEAVEKALERVDKGTYGDCETCEKVIPLARLKALPFARLCVSCQEVEERATR